MSYRSRVCSCSRFPMSLGSPVRRFPDRSRVAIWVRFANDSGSEEILLFFMLRELSAERPPKEAGSDERALSTKFKFVSETRLPNDSGNSVSLEDLKSL